MGISSCARLVDPLRRSLMPTLLHGWPTSLSTTLPGPVMPIPQDESDSVIRPCKLPKSFSMRFRNLSPNMLSSTLNIYYFEL